MFQHPFLFLCFSNGRLLGSGISLLSITNFLYCSCLGMAMSDVDPSLSKTTKIFLLLSLYSWTAILNSQHGLGSWASADFFPGGRDQKHYLPKKHINKYYFPQKKVQKLCVKIYSVYKP